MNGNGSDAEPRPRANVPTALALVVAAVAVLGGAAWAYDRAAPNVDVVRLELAGTLAEAQRVAGANAAAFADAVRADFVLIAGYVVALLLLGVLGQRVFWTPGARKMVSRMMVVAVAAAALDAAENALLLDFLHRPTVLDGELTMRLAQAAAFTKFTLLAAAGIVAVVAVGVTLSRLLLLLWSHLWGSTREPLRRGVDVFAPVQPSPSSNGGATTHWDSARNVPPRRDVADVGIAVSGGGIRSACVTLGALQSLRQRGELQRASYLVSVSGGGYMAGAFRLALQQVPDRPPPTGTNDASPRDVFAPGSAEEDHLRRHSNYVADGAREWIIALWTVLRGVVVSLALITLTVAVAGLLLSRFYELVRVVHLDQLRPRFVADPAQKAPAFPSPPAGVLLAIGATAVAAFASFGFGILVLSVFAKPFRRRGRITRDLAALAALLAVIGVALPALVWASARLTWGLGVKGAVSTATGSAVGAVLLAYLGTLVGVLWRKRQTIGKQVGTVRGWITGAGGKSGTQQAVPTSLLQRLIVLAALLILSLGFLLVLGWVVATAPLWPTSWRFGLPAVLAFCAIFLDQTWLGLHPFYRRRLASAFAVRRLKSPKGKVFAAAYPFDAESTRLSDYAARPPSGDFPKVIFAAAANLSGQDRTPPGRHAVSYTLAGDFVGGPDVGWVKTEKLERHVSRHLARDLTVQAAVAISGAAFASAMGRQAKAFQTFFALSNARLGAWLPNPAFLYGEAIDPGEDPRTARKQWTRPRLPWVRRLSYLLREIAGRYPCENRLLFCTDGGHYENLGLVELLRRGCELAYCIDASGDSPPLAATLAEAITLASEELGITIDLHEPYDLVPGSADALEPKDPLAGLNSRLSKTAICTGTIHYPPEPGFPNGRTGRLVVAKAALTADLPCQLLSYASKNPVFPRDSTSDQWFDQGQFDAYQALGRYLGHQAVDAAERPGVPRPHKRKNGQARSLTITWSEP
ncbi:MAG TPA: hypothetical protein VFD04_05325 [Actinomycetes bacterium]|nr:hypothetical protein [Actinomycetes bacterium]